MKGCWKGGCIVRTAGEVTVGIAGKRVVRAAGEGILRGYEE